MKHLDLHLLKPLNPTLTLQVQAGAKKVNYRSLEVEALIDTGFDDYLSLPLNLARTLGLKVIGQTVVELADGNQYLVDISKGWVCLPGIPNLLLEVNIILGDDEEALIGTRFLQSLCSKFSIDFKNSLLTLENIVF